MLSPSCGLGCLPSHVAHDNLRSNADATAGTEDAGLLCAKRILSHVTAQLLLASLHQELPPRTVAKKVRSFVRGMQGVLALRKIALERNTSA